MINTNNTTNNTNNKDKKMDMWDSDSSMDSDMHESVILGKQVPLIKDDDENILRTDSFREYIENVKYFEDLQSMFISMILDLKERVKGCEHCETCSQVIEIVDINIRACKKVSKLAHGFAYIFMHIVKGVIPEKLNENTKRLLNVAFILFVKNSKFLDIQYIYQKFKAFIDVNSFDGLALRLAIQKYKPVEIRIMIYEWGCNITVRDHRPIIRAFHYQKFGIVRTLIELGSSYKYFLKEELSPTQYEVFQTTIDKYLANQMPEATPLEKEFHIVGMINDFRHILLAEDASANNNEVDDDYNPISTDYFIEDFMDYFYEKTGISPSNTSSNTSSESNKKKKKKKKNKKKKQLETASVPNEPPLDNQYDLLNDETFNLEPPSQELPSQELPPNLEIQTILLDSYYSDKLTADVPKNQIHLGNWNPSYAMEEFNYWNKWDSHFQNVFSQYSY
jgi:hypothetical protein